MKTIDEQELQRLRSLIGKWVKLKTQKEKIFFIGLAQDNIPILENGFNYLRVPITTNIVGEWAEPRRYSGEIWTNICFDSFGEKHYESYGSQSEAEAHRHGSVNWLACVKSTYDVAEGEGLNETVETN